MNENNLIKKEGDLFYIGIGENRYYAGTIEMYRFLNSVFIVGNQKEFLLPLLTTIIKNLPLESNENNNQDFYDQVEAFFDNLSTFVGHLSFNEKKEFKMIILVRKRSIVDGNIFKIKLNELAARINTEGNRSNVLRNAPNENFSSVENAMDEIFRNLGESNNDIYLSSLDSNYNNGENTFREYCKKYVGESSKVKEEDQRKINEKFQVFFKFFIKFFMDTANDQNISFSSNEKININCVLYYLVEKPIISENFIKIIKNFPYVEENFLRGFISIFENKTLRIDGLPSNRNLYIGGSKERQSSIYYNDEPFNVDIKIIKSFMCILNFSSNLNHNNFPDLKLEYDSIINNNQITSGPSLLLDIWQEEFINKISERKSVILVGDTSGGKTFISLMAMKKLFIEGYNERNSNDLYIYVAPTSQLVILQFSNILRMYPQYSDRIGICCKSVIDIPIGSKIIMGTPVEVKNYLYRYNHNISRSIRKDNFKEKLDEFFENPSKLQTNIVFFDEIQTLSKTYVQQKESEEFKQCKAMEEIMNTLTSTSQIICLSATLSDISIGNLIDKITNISGISDIEVVKYEYANIGMNKENQENFQPIMRRPIKIPVKILDRIIGEFLEGEEIINVDLTPDNLELIVRDAKNKGVLPLAFYQASELLSINSFKNFVDYLEQSNRKCTIWNGLREAYNRNDFSINESTKIDNILGRISIEIDEIKYTSDESNVYSEDFPSLLENYLSYHNNLTGSNETVENIKFSIELYGLLYEYNEIIHGRRAFIKDVHPFYRFNNVGNISEFNMETNNEIVDILSRQGVNIQNDRGIVQLILKGMRFGVGLITSSIPLGFQLEFFKYINIKSKLNTLPIPILFCEYGMSMGVNFSLMSVCILRNQLEEISSSEFKQIFGRPGRRGNLSEATPIVYTLNISNVFNINLEETLNFDLTDQKSSFFEPGQKLDFLSKLLVLYKIHRAIIEDRNETNINSIVSSDIFHFSNDVLLIRKIQIIKIQIVDIFNSIKYKFPNKANNEIKNLFDYLQKCEFYYLNNQTL